MLLALEKQHRQDIERMQVDNQKRTFPRQIWPEILNKKRQENQCETKYCMKPKVTEL